MSEEAIIQAIQDLQVRHGTTDVTLQLVGEEMKWKLLICTWDNDGNLLNSKGWTDINLPDLYIQAMIGDLKS